MSAAVFAEPPRRPKRPRCPHNPPCPAEGPAACPVDARREHGWTLLCNGVTLFEDGSWKAPLLPPPLVPGAMDMKVYGVTAGGVHYPLPLEPAAAGVCPIEGCHCGGIDA